MRSASLLVLLEFYRNWLTSDGYLHHEIRRHHLDAVKVLVREYGVARTIDTPHDAHGDGVRRLFDEVCTEIDRSWPGDLNGRANTCKDIAQNYRDNFSSSKKPKAPYSAVTKIIWFLKPDGFTMFDSYASKAVKGDGIIKFYEFLDHADFVSHACEISVVLDKHGIPAFGGRIIDKLLWLHGTDKPPQTSFAKSAKFFSLMPDSLRASMKNAAAEIEAPLATFANKLGKPFDWDEATLVEYLNRYAN